MRGINGAEAQANYRRFLAVFFAFFATFFAFFFAAMVCKCFEC
jgi:hypothetical protein